MLGEPNTEQFEVTVRVDHKIVHNQKIHDPFVRTTTTIRGLKAAWRCLFGGLCVTTCVDGSHGAMSAVMMLDPIKLADDSLRLSRRDDSTTASPLTQSGKSFTRAEFE